LRLKRIARKGWVSPGLGIWRVVRKSSTWVSLDRTPSRRTAEGERPAAIRWPLPSGYWTVRDTEVECERLPEVALIMIVDEPRCVPVLMPLLL